MVCGFDFCIINVVVKWLGFVYDFRIFKEFVLCREFENGMLFGMFYYVVILYFYYLFENKFIIIRII